MFEPEVILGVEDSLQTFKQLVTPSVGRPQRTTSNNINSGKGKNARIHNKLMDTTSTFLADFNPEHSAREQRKLSRKTNNAPQQHTNPSKTGYLHDNKGYFKLTGEDLCDCLDYSCPGCFFPCRNCNSTRCGPTCRISRKWMYEQIEHDGKDKIINNKYANYKGILHYK